MSGPYAAATMRTAGVTFVIALVVGAFFVLDIRSARSDTGSATATVSAHNPNPLVVEIVAIEPDSSVELGSRFRVIATVTNSSGQRMHRGEATLHVAIGPLVILTADNLEVPGPLARNFGALNDGRTKTARWTVQVDPAAEFGTYVVTVVATATLGRDGDAVEGEDSAVVEVVP